VENAFKYGVNSEEDSKIDIQIKVQKNVLMVFVQNNKVSLYHSMFEKNGVGIENTLKRLDLIYPHQHQCIIKETEKDFTVTLQITLS
jgi:sensor histidine kinase YesM